MRAVRLALPRAGRPHRRPGADIPRRGLRVPLRIVSWNVARRIATLVAQAAALTERKPDVVALQEVTATSIPGWRDVLAAAGLPHVITSLDDAPSVRAPVGPRRTGVLLASRAPLEPLATAIAVPWPEVVLSGVTDGIQVHVAHVPNSRNGWIKVETLEGIRSGLAGATDPAVLCGDFNTPRSERPDGTVITFARDRYGRLRPERGERWDAAELGILTGLWPDAFRTLHGYERKEISWNWPRFPRSGYRLDHVLTTVAPGRCEYVHDVRHARLSDHSALEIDI